MTLGIVASPATANLNAGKTVTLTANFSEAVAVGSGMPTLNLNDGGKATYVSGSSSSALTFTYTIAAGQNTSDLQVTGFNGATIQDGAGNSANLSGITAANPVNPTGTLKIDTTAPTVISVVASPSKGTIATGKTVNIKLNMSENVTVATGADILWTLNHPEVWQLLVGARRWSASRYERWFADAACSELLAPGP